VLVVCSIWCWPITINMGGCYTSWIDQYLHIDATMLVLSITLLHNRIISLLITTTVAMKDGKFHHHSVFIHHYWIKYWSGWSIFTARCYAKRGICHHTKMGHMSKTMPILGVICHPLGKTWYSLHLFKIWQL